MSDKKVESSLDKIIELANRVKKWDGFYDITASYQGINISIKGKSYGFFDFNWNNPRKYEISAEYNGINIGEYYIKKKDLKFAEIDKLYKKNKSEKEQQGKDKRKEAINHVEDVLRQGK